MLHARALAEGGVEEVGDVASGKDVGLAGSQLFIDHDPIVDGKAGLPGQLHVELDAEPGHDRVRRDGARALGLHPVSVARGLDPLDRVADEHGHPFTAVVLHQVA